MTEKERKNYDKLFRSLTELNDVETRLDLLSQAVSPMTSEIVRSINNSAYESAVLIRDFVPEVRNTIDLPDSYWNAIHTGMRRVVQKKAYYNDLGVDVAGKTGTAQESKSRTNHALFVSYAPYNNPEIAVATRIAFGYSSDYAANATRDIYKYYFDLEEEDDILTGTAEVPDVVISGGD